MILPTIISISVDSLQAVPPSYREGSIALGATRWQTVKMVLFPAARSGIVASIILGMGRAIGETMATIMIAGNAAEIPRSLLMPVRTLTSNIALEMSYATGEHREALFATGVILFIIIMILNTIANATSSRSAGDSREAPRPPRRTEGRPDDPLGHDPGHGRRPALHHLLRPAPRPARPELGVPDDQPRGHGQGRRHLLDRSSAWSP